MSDYDGFEGYFYSRKGLIFSLLAVPFLVDIADTLIKGRQYFYVLGFVYYFRTACLLSAKPGGNQGEQSAISRGACDFRRDL
jgi:hypothetical protein